MLGVLTNKGVIANAVLLLVSILTAAGVNIGVDVTTVQTAVAVLATVINGVVHAHGGMDK